MKKWIAPICSALAGFFTLILLGVEWIQLKPTSDFTIKYSGWDLIKYQAEIFENFKGYNLFRVSAIILAVLAVLLIVSAVLVALQNANVIKLNFDLSLINSILLAVFVVVVVLVFVGLLQMRADVLDKFKTYKVAAMFGSIATAVVSVLACAGSWLGWVFARKAK